MTDEETDAREMSAKSAQRLYRYVRTVEMPAQTLFDIGVVLGRLSKLEGPGWPGDDSPAASDG